MENQPRSNLIFLTDWLRKKARINELKGSHELSVSYLEDLLRRSTRMSADVTDLAAIHYQLGLAHRVLKDDLKSLYHFKYSIRLNASEPRYYEAFGRVFLSGGHWRVAKSQFEKAVSLDPLNIHYLREYAWTLLMIGKKDEARAIIGKAVKLNPEDPETQWSRFRILVDSSMFLHALDVLKILQRLGADKKRLKDFEDECREKLAGSFEGDVLKLLRTRSGLPFRELRRAEKVWTDFCIASEDLHSKTENSANIWAAGVAWYVVPSDDFADFDFWTEHFQTDSLRVWPCFYQLQKTLGVPAQISDRMLSDERQR